MSRDDNPENYGDHAEFEFDSGKYEFDGELPAWKEWLWFIVIVLSAGTVFVQCIKGYIMLLETLQNYM